MRIKRNASWIAALFVLIFVASDVRTKEWRSIIPLKSTEADVERLFGKPNKLGRYEIQNERVSVLYSEGNCANEYRSLSTINCECLVPKGTVLRVGVVFESPIKVSSLGIDQKKFQRTPVNAYRPTATYSNFSEGVVYTILESESTVIGIDYLPSSLDCEETIRRQSSDTAPNIWKGFIPLRSTRADIEGSLGPPTMSVGNISVYFAAEGRVEVSYSADACKGSSVNPRGLAADVVLRISVLPQRTLLVDDLRLDKAKYKRIEEDHPENWVQYLSSEEGLTINTVSTDGCEQVRSIIYQPTTKDRDWRCGTKARIESRLMTVTKKFSF